MDVSLLDVLRCPFCGTRLDLVDNEALVRDGSRIVWGVLGCQCCAFPIVDEIPVLLADDPTRTAMHAMEAGRPDDALASLLGLDRAGAGRLRDLLQQGDATYRDALAIISPDAEGTYFIYRFSDPTFVLAETLVRAIGADRRRTAHVIDLCGGSGHLTRVLGELSDRPVVVADVYFSKLWLAQRFTAPGCVPICCDGNQPLPFARDTFSMVVLSDAFPYIWHKRLLAEEMLRLAGRNGTILMPHLHSSLGFNFSAGMTLTPAAYRDLFAPANPRLFRDSDLLGDILGHSSIDLSRDVTPEQAGDEPSVTLVASGDAGVFRKHLSADPGALTGELRVNPLYRVEQRGAQATLTLTFPTPEYEEEFGAVRRYLPDTVTLDADLSGRLDPSRFGASYLDLRRRRILLDTPPRYV
jgi:uncharacterized protein YbaR (Trm112 family)/SAM-dependent methyltransferase